MYKDTANNVTVGIGLKLDNPQVAKDLPFVIRGTNTLAHDNHVINAFNKVKKSKINPNNGAAAFEFVTNIELSAAKAEESAMNAVEDFLKLIVKSTSFPEFDSYPETAKMGLLDMVYTKGTRGTKRDFPDFTDAVRKRNWKLAAKESHRSSVSPKPGVTPDRNQIVRQWFEQAARQEHFFINSACPPNRIKIQLQ
jgi:GH24 family phage-related lysozyme (muramidase)